MGISPKYGYKFQGILEREKHSKEESATEDRK